MVLCERLRNENQLMNQYFRLLEDNECLEVTTNQSRRISDMKDTYRRMCCKCFTRFRDATISLRQRFVLNADIDEDLNFLCCLPIESFERFTAEDVSDITLSALKIMKLFDELIHESDQTCGELMSIYKCAKSLWLSSERSLVKSRDLRQQTTQSIETSSLLNTNRNIRKHLMIALNIVDELDSLVEEDDIERATDFRHQMRQKLDSIDSEFKELKDSKNKLFNNIEVNGSEDSVKQLPTLSSVAAEDYVVRDQVFEAIVTEDCDESDHNSSEEEDEELREYRLKLSQESIASHNLFRELKVALISKAAEHERREAKALGIEIPVNVVKDDLQDSDQSVNSVSDEHSSESLSKRIPFTDSKQSMNESLGQSFGFESQIAAFAAQKARDFGISDETERFGDDSDSESDE
ncbi:unnamed protein product [Oppiella nova]|uniref:Uncharacterized protein n=1 Tax=Oppiella nova TaxID=334625 RepID=A0A7R9LMU7_9ACAR|nr:unnamed protein product [Oppiella nova]CAG2165175.1 unnamed protein product [Oppiella nova]